MMYIRFERWLFGQDAPSVARLVIVIQVLALPIVVLLGGFDESRILLELIAGSLLALVGCILYDRGADFRGRILVGFGAAPIVFFGYWLWLPAGILLTMIYVLAFSVSLIA